MEKLILCINKKIPFIMLVLVLLFASTTGVSAQYQNIPTAGLYVNGEVVDGINPIKVNGLYHLPFVHLSKTLGYNHIKFEQATSTFEVTDGSTKIRTTMGGTKARRGDEYINIEPPRWINETAYVSLTAAGSLFNANIHFKPENGSIQVQKPAQFYIVETGDTLWTIAEAHHTTVQALKEVNQLTTNVIYDNQKLKLPPRKQVKEVEPIKEQKPVKREEVKPNTQIQNVLDQAMQYIGAGYKFGATLDEAPNLFDCSSFTQLVFQQNGVDIPRVSRDQAGIGYQVTELKAGDLMFFTNNELYSDGRVGHVGIYMGDGSMIHASSSLGVNITENVLGNSYWGANYLFSKRVIN
ncbi:C40 family peptidase [Halalkalibacter akibai]|uniref:Lipoprotein n=1 Tax=Halalkalibacter akibai (strain ATCC 43226 / DSM 21942 / CIP 109018 / JCM 9157 / 1139) TaxID=1236973 RepID=W4QVK8_HALA3|nr:LysM peptidoglycan-binding domain-containing C40 family peptidase [Halalkalibacter akibai]GAE36190.1 lipoprotein [Halalkalibacter akibai JCM 9157]